MKLNPTFIVFAAMCLGACILPRVQAQENGRVAPVEAREMCSQMGEITGVWARRRDAGVPYGQAVGEVKANFTDPDRQPVLLKTLDVVYKHPELNAADLSTASRDACINAARDQSVL
jgi:hypothetical protein